MFSRSQMIEKFGDIVTKLEKNPLYSAEEIIERKKYENIKSKQQIADTTEQINSLIDYKIRLEKSIIDNQKDIKSLKSIKKWMEEYETARRKINNYLDELDYPEFTGTLQELWTDVLGFKGATSRAMEILCDIMDDEGYIRRPGGYGSIVFKKNED